jgi:hypothetical protein
MTVAISDVIFEACEEIKVFVEQAPGYQHDREVIEGVLVVMNWLRQRYDRSPSTPVPARDADALAIIALGKRLHDDEPTLARHLIQVCGDFEPYLFGPFATEEDRDAEARRLHGEDEGTLFRLDIEDGLPEVYSFSYGELGEIED